MQPAITRTIGTDAQATLQDYMASDTHVFGNNLINQCPRVLQPHRRQPAGDQRPDQQRVRHQRAAQRPLGAGRGQHRHHRALRRRGRHRRHRRPRRPAAALRRSPQRVVPVRQRRHLGARAALGEAGPRRAQGAHVHRLREPPQRRLHVHAASTPATPRPTSCSGCRRSSAAPPPTPARTAAGGRMPATSRTNSARCRT